MPYTGSGAFAVYTPGNPVVTGTPISSTAFNATTNDFATGLSNAITRDGQGPATANIAFGGFKITGLAAGTAATDAMNVGQAQAGASSYLTGVAGTNTITASLASLTAYTTGMVVRFIAAGANTGAVTLNINSIGAAAVTKNGTTPLVTGDILSGLFYQLTYDGTQFQITAYAGTYMAGPGTVAAPSYTFGGDTDTGIYKIGPGELGIAVDGARALFLDGGGAVAISFIAEDSSTPGVVGSATNPAIAFTNGQNPGMFSPAADTVAFSTNNIERLRITSAGVIQDGAGIPFRAMAEIKPIIATVAANALTITLSPAVLDFRSATLGSGTVTSISVSAAISVVVPSTATLGTINAVQNRLAVIAILFGGAAELAVVNIAGGANLDETTLLTTTAISTAADFDSVVYSTAARASVPFRVVGYVESTQATAGTWATAPSTIQGQGGQALSAMSSLGYGQTWQNLTASRATGTTYYNTTGKPIFIAGTLTSTVAGAMSRVVTGAADYTNSYNANASQGLGFFGLIPANGSYLVTANVGTPTITGWFELR